MLKLKRIISDLGRAQSELARAVGLSESSIAQLVNHNIRPRGHWEATAEKIRVQLHVWGVPAETISHAFDWEGDAPPRGRRQPPHAEPSTSQPTPEEEQPMFFRHQRLHPAARKHFGLSRDPFYREFNSPDDFYPSPQFRYVREEMYQAAVSAGFMAVVGESGSGKSTLLHELTERIQNERQRVVVIEPRSTTFMEETSSIGRIMRADTIADSIINTISPLAPSRRGMEIKARQLHAALSTSAEAGNSHVLVIEEAHCLSTTTLKHLKRFSELRSGFTWLLGIILIGHPELSLKLSEQSAAVREVVQRIDLVELPALDDVADYLRFKLGRSNRKAEEVFAADAYPAIAARLQDARIKRSRAHPLAVNNLAVDAMNLAAGIGSPRVTAEIVREIK